MALFAAARRAAASSVPLLRASASSVPLLRASASGASLLRPLAAALARPRPRAMPFSSAPATKPSSDGELSRIIDSKIKYAEEFDGHDRVEEIPDNFPFKISDAKGTTEITLTRTYQGEQIEVLVSMPSLVTGDEPELTGDEPEQDQDEDDEEREYGQEDKGIPLTVTVSKGDGPSLEFTCIAYPDGIIIDTLSVRQPSGDEEEELIAYEGPDFDDLDENLQRAFHKYLEVRGMTPVTTIFLHEYMFNKYIREYLFWLRKLKDFIKH